MEYKKNRLGINGFGRIGRNVFKVAFESGKCDVVVINDLTDAETLAHLLRYDSVYGIWDKKIEVKDNRLIVDGRVTHVTSQASLDNMEWGKHDISVVVESTGRFTNADVARKHITQGGAQKVIISAPASNEDITIVLGVNENSYDINKHHVISNASCTTNCLAPIVKVLLEHVGFKKGFMTTVHSYTNDQNVLDSPHKDLRRARTAGVSMIPTTTGAAKAVSLVLPAVKGRLDGMAVRVPTPNVSLIDLVFEAEQKITTKQLNQLLKDQASNHLVGILGYTEEQLVSVDFLRNPLSSIVDAPSTSVIDGALGKIISWYDNEWGYSHRIVDLVNHIHLK